MLQNPSWLIWKILKNNRSNFEIIHSNDVDMTKNFGAYLFIHFFIYSINKGNISVVALPDLSSAFDTIDHPIPVHRLHTDFGFTDAVLQWF